MKKQNIGNIAPGMVLLETIAHTIRFLFCAVVIVGLVFLIRFAIFQAEDRIASAQVEPNPTHFMIQYTVDGKIYVRTLSYATAQLIEGTARDFNISPPVLLAMCIQEGSVPNPDGNYYACDATAKGDNNRARGMFQILYKLHGITIADAEHPYFSARFTAERLIAKGYNVNRERAIQSHNGYRQGNPYGKRILQIARTLKPITQ